MSTPQDYHERLAGIDEIIARAQPAPAVLVERAAVLLAGRVDCRVDEAGPLRCGISRHAERAGHVRQIA